MNSQRQPNWWERNWKWAAPAILLGGFTVLCGFIGLVFWFIASMMKSSDVYQDAIAMAQSHPAAIAALGSPIKDGFFIMGEMSTSGGSGSCDIEIPLSGPKGGATLYVVAAKSAGEWSISKLVLKVDATRRRIDLLEGAKGKSPPDAKNSPPEAKEPSPAGGSEKATTETKENAIPGTGEKPSSDPSGKTLPEVESKK